MPGCSGLVLCCDDCTAGGGGATFGSTGVAATSGPGFVGCRGWSDFSRCAGRAACDGALACVVGARGASAITGAAGALWSSDFPRASDGAMGAVAAGRRWVGGATFVFAITFTAGVATADFNSLRVASSSGLPGFAVSCGCCAEKPIRASGGASRTRGQAACRPVRHCLARFFQSGPGVERPPSAP